MLITKIEIQKKDKNRVNLFIDDSFCCGLSLESVMKNHIKENQEITENFLEYLKNESEVSLAVAKSGRYLSKMMKSEKELKTYLSKKGFDDQTVLKSVKKMKDYGYIDDAVYSKNFVKSKSNSFGKKKIAFDLKNKGISENIIEASLSHLQNETSTAQKLLAKYIKNKELTLKTKQNAYRFLSSKGFKNDDILFCLKNFFKED